MSPEVDLVARTCACGLVPYRDAAHARAAATGVNAKTRSKHRVAAGRCVFGGHHVAAASRVRYVRVRGHFDRNPHHADRLDR